MRAGFFTRSAAQAMKITYNHDTDTLTIILAESPGSENSEDSQGMIFDYDDSGRFSALRILELRGPFKRVIVREGESYNNNPLLPVINAN